MIALLRGRVAAVSLGDVVVDVAGVGYRVRIAPGEAVGVVGAELVLHTHLAVREDALTLYGFLDSAARDMFSTLLNVTGVGPKLALAAIGALGAGGLRRAVIAEDIDALTVVPGVGRKGAARMILELRERMGSAAVGDSVPGGNGHTGPGSAREEVREAMAALGYAAGEIQAALDAVGSDAEASVEQLLRAALQSIGKSAARR
ncbi:MAG TPA: Holliday junction branch migration protein RuvA [Egibacteraceae bacterium]|nr:Holliday junction branch migration protein RuvA [Egibacteraceae bacterium]